MDHICNALLRMGLKLSLIRLGLLVTSWWTMVHMTKEVHIMQPYTLIIAMLFTINRVWTRRTGMGQFQRCYCFIVSNFKMFMRLLTQASIIYIYYWNCKLPLLMLQKNLSFIPIMIYAITSFSYIVQEYLISLNAIQKILLSNKSLYFTIKHLLFLFLYFFKLCLKVRLYRIVNFRSLHSADCQIYVRQQDAIWEEREKTAIRL